MFPRPSLPSARASPNGVPAQVTTAVSAVENALDGVNGTSIEILAAVFCDRGVASGVQARCG